jgi:hypothetical protein
MTPLADTSGDRLLPIRLGLCHGTIVAPTLTISALTRAAHEKNVSDPATGRELMLIVQAFGSGPERCCPRSSPPDAVRQC